MAQDKLNDLESLSLEQLAHVKNNIEREFNALEESIKSLNFVTQKYKEVCYVLNKLEGTDEGNEAFIPLTNSLYVPGKIKDVNKFKVDIGTGFFVEKSRKEAIEYYNRKIDQIVPNSQLLKKIRETKLKDFQQVKMLLDLKMQSNPTASE